MGLVNKINKNKIVAILRGLAFNDTDAVCTALLRGGVDVMEFTIDHNKKDCLAGACRKIAHIADRYRGQVHVGAGTVLSLDEAKEVIAAGAEFIVSPNTNIEIIKFTKISGLVSIPGAMTASECLTAYDAGADFIKLFPAGELGIAYTKALMMPLPHLPFLIVGKITPDVVKDYINIGVRAFGLGSGLVPKDAVAAKDYDLIEACAREYVKAMRTQ